MGSGFVIAPASRTHATAIEDALAPFRAQLEDPLVTDVFVNGSRGMFVDRGAGTEPVPGWTASEREVRELAYELIAQGGRHVDDAHPCVDVRLRDGIRVHAVLAPIATAGTTLSIRIPRFAATTLTTLVEQGMIDHSLETVLRQAVARRANLLVSGAAGVGKTTLLSALLGEAPPTERIVTIEDVAEIALDHPHHVALESRQANLEGAGEVGLARLVREALRMKPDRLVIGECRGAEVRELLSALNTGHDGGAGTVHANSLADVATRLEALGALAGLDETALARQVTSAIEFVIHLERDEHGRRRVAAVGEFRIVEGRLFVVPKEVPHIVETSPTRRSRRQALGLIGAGAEKPRGPMPGGAAAPAADTMTPTPPRATTRVTGDVRVQDSPESAAQNPILGAARTVLPTFDQWRERLGMPRQQNSSRDDLSPTTGVADDAARGDGGRENDGHRRRDGSGARDGGPRGGDASHTAGGRRDDDRGWSEQSMRAQRAPRTVAALTPAELDAQWARLVDGWEESTPPAAAVESADPSEPAVPVSEPRRGHREGGAWTFVPAPAAPAETGGVSRAQS